MQVSEVSMTVKHTRTHTRKKTLEAFDMPICFDLGLLIWCLEGHPPCKKISKIPVVCFWEPGLVGYGFWKAAL